MAVNKSFLFIISLFGMGLIAHAEPYQLEGIPFQTATNVEIVWTASVTNVSKNLWVYKVVPADFSMVVVSNLLTFCHLESKNLTKPQYAAAPDKDLAHFEIQNPSKRILHSLDIAPNLGWISYYGNTSDIHKMQPAPSEDQVIDLSFDILFLAGIDRSQVLRKPKNYTVTTTQVGDKPEIISERSVFLVRRIDGINERGFCFTADFACEDNEPKLKSFDLNWRNLTPYEARQVATTNEMADFIRNGLGRIPFTDFDTESLKHAKKLTVTTFFPLYYNQYGFKPVEYEFPYAAMDVVADMGNGHTVSFPVNCPMLSTNLPNTLFRD
jgi:hypothetical protein